MTDDGNCGVERLQAILTLAAADDTAGLIALDEALGDFPGDARLYFLKGSLLAGLGRAIEAHPALARAVALAPDFAIARFQLGLFELTSGEADRALSSWGPLQRLPDGHHLRWFVAGLTHMIEDRFAEAIDAIAAGIATNGEHLPLNTDMALVIDRCREALAAARSGAPEAIDELSATSLLLGSMQRGERLH